MSTLDTLVFYFLMATLRGWEEWGWNVCLSKVRGECCSDCWVDFSVTRGCSADVGVVRAIPPMELLLNH